MYIVFGNKTFGRHKKNNVHTKNRNESSFETIKKKNARFNYRNLSGAPYQKREVTSEKRPATTNDTMRVEVANGRKVPGMRKGFGTAMRDFAWLLSLWFDM